MASFFFYIYCFTWELYNTRMIRQRVCNVKGYRWHIFLERELHVLLSDCVGFGGIRKRSVASTSPTTSLPTASPVRSGRCKDLILYQRLHYQQYLCGDCKPDWAFWCGENQSQSYQGRETPNLALALFLTPEPPTNLPDATEDMARLPWLALPADAVPNTGTTIGLCVCQELTKISRIYNRVNSITNLFFSWTLLICEIHHELY